MKRTLILVVALSTLLAACGTSPTDRAISGGSIGGATFGSGIVIAGALGAAVPFGIIPAVILGAALGASAGLVTSPAQVNLGAPPWHPGS
jgi:ABC-type phosphate transport system permease subunit